MPVCVCVYLSVCMTKTQNEDREGRGEGKKINTQMATTTSTHTSIHIHNILTLAPITSSIAGRRLARPECATPKKDSNNAIVACDECPGARPSINCIYSSPKPVEGLIHAKNSPPKTVTRRTVKMAQSCVCVCVCVCMYVYVYIYRERDP